VVDAGNGTAGPVAVEVFERLGCRVDPLYCDPDGRFPNHLADPTVPAFMHDLVERVRSTGADLGIGLDGDGDRIGVVDDRGRLVYGDQLLAIFARDVIERTGPAEIIFDVKCSQGLIEDIQAHGGTPVMWRTGHSLIKARMKETGAPIAGEMSGHMFFSEGWYGFDDAVYAGARLLGILDRWGGRLSEVVDDIPYYHSTPEIRVSCADEEKFGVLWDGFGRMSADNCRKVLEANPAFNPGSDFGDFVAALTTSLSGNAARSMYARGHYDAELNVFTAYKIFVYILEP